MIRTALLLAATLLSDAPPVGAFSPVLPTDNDALFRGKPADFYMFTDRNFEGRKTFPWEGGTYGFSRGPERLGRDVVLTKFHEGIDIRPVRRDAAGEPLDDVRAIEDGKVVHVSHEPRDSNYGKYVVVEHTVENTPVFSIYAHLADADVVPGRRVQRGERIGRLGHTGAGIDKRRAHLHLEIAVLWNDGYEHWHNTHFTQPNKHGIYNGMNLMGLDVADFYLQQRRNPSLTLPQFVAGQETSFRVRLPDSPHFQLPLRYPWLVQGDPDSARSWLVSFTSAGFPVSIQASPERTGEPRVEWARPSTIPLGKATRSLLGGTPGQPRLGDSGQKLMQLLSVDPAPEPPAADGM